jgi:hypothetical protein
MRYSKGVSWFDDCRIPFVENDKFDIRRYDTNNVFRMDNPESTYNVNQPNTKGRFPANLLVSDDMLNDGSITETTTSVVNNKQVNNIGLGLKPISCKKQGDKGSNSRYYDIDKWFNNLIDVE